MCMTFRMGPANTSTHPRSSVNMPIESPYMTCYLTKQKLFISNLSDNLFDILSIGIELITEGQGHEEKRDVLLHYNDYMAN